MERGTQKATRFLVLKMSRCKSSMDSVCMRQQACLWQQNSWAVRLAVSNRKVSSNGQGSSKPDCLQSVPFKVLMWPFSVLAVGVYNNQDTNYLLAESHP